MKTLNYLILVGLFMGLTACHENRTENDTSNEAIPNQEVEETVYPLKKGNLTISVVESPKFANSSIKLTNHKQIEGRVGNVNFDFEVTNYKLGVQTDDAGTKGMANSDKGQHIHYIVDNGPYAAHYEPQFTEEIPPGHHVVLAFLSRSYHESVKASYVLQEQNAGGTDNFDEKAPHLFYSRPKGEYKGKEMDKVLLDWFLVNCNLSVNGYKVKATINGEEFWFDTWQAYAIEGLPEGETTIKLELFDKAGNSVKSPFNPVTRTIKLIKEKDA